MTNVLANLEQPHVGASTRIELAGRGRSTEHLTSVEAIGVITFRSKVLVGGFINVVVVPRCARSGSP